jgi:hypothetical protein
MREFIKQKNINGKPIEQGNRGSCEDTEEKNFK